MNEPFDDPKHKVENAIDHIAKAQAFFDDYVNSHPPYTAGQAGAIVAINFGPQGVLPKKIRLAVGDAIHNLRSALDILAGDVVQASGGSRKGVHFPFAGSEEGLDTQVKEKKFNRAKAEAVELLKSMHPYKGGNALLRAIHDLDLTDKHNFIIPTSNANRVTSFRMGGVSMINCTFEGNAIDIAMRGGGTPFSIGSVETELLFASNQPLGGAEVFRTLHAMAEMVSGIIESFAQLFAGGGNPAAGGPAA